MKVLFPLFEPARVNVRAAVLVEAEPPSGVVPIKPSEPVPVKLIVPEPVPEASRVAPFAPRLNSRLVVCAVLPA